MEALISHVRPCDALLGQTYLSLHEDPVNKTSNGAISDQVFLTKVDFSNISYCGCPNLTVLPATHWIMEMKEANCIS